MVDYQSMQYEFPSEDIMSLFEEKECVNDEKLTMLFDGTSYALGHGIKVVLISPKNQFIPFTAKLDFDCTNNIINYEAYAMGVLATLEFKAKVLEVYGDSALVIHQLRGEWETRDSKLIPYHPYIKGLIKLFDKITFHHIPCENNELVDALATLSTMFKINKRKDNRDKPTYCQVIEEEPEKKP
ncbi:rnhA, partial [Mucuna pruriens]